jgi:hypothetical protein
VRRTRNRNNIDPAAGRKAELLTDESEAAGLLAGVNCQARAYVSGGFRCLRTLVKILGATPSVG